jgi:vacuolar iron transporter family protein
LKAAAAAVAQSGNEARYRANLQGEIDSSALYRALAEVEADPRIAEVYRRLAGVEEAHAAFWRKRLGKRGRRPSRPSFRSRALAWLARRFGADFVLPVINTLEHADSSQYDKQPEAVAASLPQAERSHARILQAIAGPTRGMPGGMLGRIEGRHRGVGGNALRAAVLGANDGLVSNLSLVMGVVGAAFTPATILATGFAGLFAGACSMAMGEWLSVNSSRELYQKQIATEASELAEVPEEEKEELILIYQAKGLSEKEARELADRLMTDKGTALDTLVREELGIDPDELGGSAWGAAATSFVLFSLGAIVPVAPFIALGGDAAIAGSLALSGLAMAGIGAGTTLFTGRSVAFSALRQLAVGMAAAGVTFGMGRLVGMSLAG